MSADSASRPDGPFSALGIAVILLVFGIDQSTKWLAEAALPFNVPQDFAPFLTLYLTYNTGIAFSLLAGMESTFLLVLTFAITIAVIVIWMRAKEGGRLAAIGYAFIVGGALGNLVDRILFGHVVDFLLLHAGARTLFVFNLADAALTIGPLILVAAFLRPQRD